MPGPHRRAPRAAQGFRSWRRSHPQWRCDPHARPGWLFDADVSFVHTSMLHKSSNGDLGVDDDDEGRHRESPHLDVDSRSPALTRPRSHRGNRPPSTRPAMCGDLRRTALSARLACWAMDCSWVGFDQPVAGGREGGKPETPSCHITKVCCFGLRFGGDPWPEGDWSIVGGCLELSPAVRWFWTTETTTPTSSISAPHDRTGFAAPLQASHRRLPHTSSTGSTPTETPTVAARQRSRRAPRDCQARGPSMKRPDYRRFISSRCFVNLRYMVKAVSPQLEPSLHKARDQHEEMFPMRKLINVHREGRRGRASWPSTACSLAGSLPSPRRR